MSRNNATPLRALILAGDGLAASVDTERHECRSWGDLVSDADQDSTKSKVRGRSILLQARNQLGTIKSLIRYDGLARRIILCPPNTSRENLAFVAKVAEADFFVGSDLSSLDGGRDRADLNQPARSTAGSEWQEGEATEWILLTSGTTGVPKLVRHTLATLTDAIRPRNPSAAPVVWSTFYDMRRYGGLQIFLRAAITGTPLVLSDAGESLAEFVERAGQRGVTHMSGTPSHWRSALMNPAAAAIAPSYVRLSGEIADQAILNQLQIQYPQASIAHAFASTEAGVVFEVNDGKMGIPAEAIGLAAGVETKIEKDTLRVRSNRTASAYLGNDAPPLKDAEGFVDTGDVLRLRDGRYYFTGRRDGMINVGGMKVHPEEVEAVLNRHPDVGMSLVRMKKSSITGGLVIADVLLKKPAVSGEATRALRDDILGLCREELAPYKVPVSLNFVSSLALAETGKLIRHHA